jgi:hypothetical protein
MIGVDIIGGLFFLVVGFMVDSLFTYLLKKRLIDSGQIDKTSLDLLLKPIRSTSEPLKWGLLLLFGGLGLVIVEFVPYPANTSSLPYGIVSVCLAIGFLTYYRLMQR